VTRQVRNIIPGQKNQKIVYTATVQSRLQYGISTWGATYKSNLKPLIMKQKKYLKILYCKPKIYSTEDLFRDTKVATVKQIHELGTIKYIKKHQIINTQTKKERITRTIP